MTSSFADAPDPTPEVAARIHGMYLEARRLAFAGIAVTIVGWILLVGSRGDGLLLAIWTGILASAGVMLLLAGRIPRFTADQDKFGIPRLAKWANFTMGVGWGSTLFTALDAGREEPVLVWQLAVAQMAISAAALSTPNGTGTLTVLVLGPLWLLGALGGIVVGEYWVAATIIAFGCVMAPDVRIMSNRILELVTLQTMAQDESEHDALTGLLNRSGLRRRVELLDLSRTALIFLDLDGFKQVNDQQGHAAGDHVLEKVGSRLVSVVRATDVVARLGGDEFVVVLQGRDSVEPLAWRMVREIERSMTIDGTTVRVSASAGIFLGTRDTNLDAMLRGADDAMREAKRLGRGRVVQL